MRVSVNSLMQAALESGSDEDDDMPLAMLPASASAAKGPAASPSNTPASLASQPWHPPTSLTKAAQPDPSHQQHELDSSGPTVLSSLAKETTQQGEELAHAAPAVLPAEDTSIDMQTSPTAGRSEGKGLNPEAIGGSASDPGGSLAAHTAMSDGLQDQAALPGRAASTSPPGLSTAWQHAHEPHLSAAATAADDDADASRLLATQAVGLISDSESEGPAQQPADAQLSPQHAAASGESSPPSYGATADKTLVQPPHSNDKPAQRSGRPHRQNPLAAATSSAMAMLGTSSAMASEDGTLSALPTSSHLPTPPAATTVHTDDALLHLPHQRGLAEQQHSSPRGLVGVDPAAAGLMASGSGRVRLQDSSESLQQAEAEAARLAQLLPPVIYRQPSQARQLAISGKAPAGAGDVTAAVPLLVAKGAAVDDESLPGPINRMAAGASRGALQAEQSEPVMASANWQAESTGPSAEAAGLESAQTDKHDGQQLHLAEQQDGHCSHFTEQAPVQSAAQPAEAGLEIGEQAADMLEPQEGQHFSGDVHIMDVKMPVAADDVDAMDLIIPDRYGHHVQRLTYYVSWLRKIVEQQTKRLQASMQRSAIVQCSFKSCICYPMCAMN